MKALTRWRLSCHSLPIERGRHANIPKQERFCNQCNNRFLGDEVHALFMCNDNIIQSLRQKKFLTRIFQISHQLFYLDDKDRLYYFLQGHDRDVMPIVCEWFRKLDEIYSLCQYLILRFNVSQSVRLLVSYTCTLVVMCHGFILFKYFTGLLI